MKWVGARDYKVSSSDTERGEGAAGVPPTPIRNEGRAHKSRVILKACGEDTDCMSYTGKSRWCVSYTCKCLEREKDR